MKCKTFDRAKQLVAKRNPSAILSAIWYGPKGGAVKIISLLLMLMTMTATAQPFKDYDPYKNFEYKAFSCDIISVLHDHREFVETDQWPVTIKVIDDIISIVPDKIRDQRDEPAFFVILDYDIKSDSEDIKYLCYDYQHTRYTIYIESEDHLIHVRPHGEDREKIYYLTYHYE